MTIRVYPCRLEGEPLEVYQTDSRQSVADWIKSVAPSYRSDAKDKHPTVRINGRIIESSEWELTQFGPDDEVDVYIEARGVGVAIVLALVAVYIAHSMKPSTSSRRDTRTMEDPGLLANQVRWGDPIPEIAGAPISFPDYIAPPRRYYVDKTQQWVDNLVCIGRGEYLTDVSQVFVGDTSLPSLGDDAEFEVYGPGETLSSVHGEWWHSPQEVGFTSLGGSGMTLGPESYIDPVWTSGISFSGQTIVGSVAVPSTWENGMILRVEAEHELTFDGDSVSSPLLDTMGLSVSDEIELTGSRAGDYVISSITAGTGGGPGAPSIATGSAPPARLDFGVTPAELTITLAGTPYVVALGSNETDVASLVATMNSQLNVTPLSVSSNSGGILEIYQEAPFGGETISLSGDVADLLGTPTIEAGEAATPPSGAKYHVSGADFGSGTEIAAAGIVGLLYSIVNISGNVLTVNPGEVAFWSGFPAGISNTTSSVNLDAGSQQGGWVGPFTTVPRGETADAIEVDIFYPNGLIHYTSKGYWRQTSSGGMIAWRYIGDSSWNDVPFTNTEATPDQIGFTYRINLPTPGRVEVRVRGDGWDHKKQWTGLRARIVGAPTSYPGMTVAHIRLRSGDKISAGAENKISVRAMRVLPTVEDANVTAGTRDIVPFFIYMMESVGYGRELLDMPQLEALHDIWTARGDTFDLSVNSSSTLKTVANYCLNAGFAEMTLRRGKISAARDSLQSGVPGRIYSLQEMTQPVTETTETIMPDDNDGVDVEYVDYLTGRTLTASYRLPGDLGVRVQQIRAPGVTDETRAWRIAARNRRISAYRRTMFRGATELAAMNSYYWDFVGLQDGIPEWGQSAFVVDVISATEFILSEEVIFVGGDLVVRIRLPDGTASDPISATYDGAHVTLDEEPDGIDITSDPNNPTVFYLGQNMGIAHYAFMTEVNPSGEGVVEFQAVKYDERVYEEDDNAP